MPPDTALDRIDAGRHARELFEQRDTLASTRAAFMDAIATVRGVGARVEVLDATRPIADLEDEIAALVLPLIERRPQVVRSDRPSLRPARR